MMQDGAVSSNASSAAFSFADLASIIKDTRLLPDILAHSSTFPSGAIARFRGPPPPLSIISIRSSVPSLFTR